ncbi:hypothetical protein Ciccas_007355, partial [Cichlidogyrus casuarinus]
LISLLGGGCWLHSESSRILRSSLTTSRSRIIHDGTGDNPTTSSCVSQHNNKTKAARTSPVMNIQVIASSRTFLRSPQKIIFGAIASRAATNFSQDTLFLLLVVVVTVNRLLRYAPTPLPLINISLALPI